MKNNLPIKEDISWTGKIKKFFRRLFYKNYIKNDISKNLEEIQESMSEITKSIKFGDNIKVEQKNKNISDLKKEEFLDNLEKNPEFFYKLPIEKLEKLEEYYKESINRYEEKLKKIKKAS